MALLMLSIFYSAQTSSTNLTKRITEKIGLSDLINFDNIHYPKNQSRANKQVLDSLLVYNLDENTNQLSLTPNGKTILSYDSTGKTSVSISFYDEDGESGGEKEEFFYDSNNLILVQDYDWDDSLNVWVTIGKEENIYDSAGNLHIVTEFDFINNAWENEGKTVFTYDSNNNIFEEFYLSFYNLSWDSNTVKKYYYDSNNNLSEMIWLEHNGIEYTPKEKQQFTYDSNYNKLEEIIYMYDNMWENFEKKTNTYDTHNRRIQQIEYEGQDSTWEFREKTITTFDSIGKITEEIVQEWDADSTQWFNRVKFQFSYNENFSFNDLVLPNGFNDDETNWFNYRLDQLQAFLYDSLNNEILFANYEFYYSQRNILDLLDLEELSFQIFPNPTSDYLNFSFQSNSNRNTFELYDLKGRKVMTSTIRSGEQLNMSSLTNGIYLYNINIDGKRQSGKIIKH
jgi:hypothetical protein